MHVLNSCGDINKQMYLITSEYSTSCEYSSSCEYSTSFSPFSAVDGFDVNESNPFAVSKPAPVAEDLDGFDAPAEEPAVEEPTKVVKKSAPAPAESEDLSAIIDNWDD